MKKRDKEEKERKQRKKEERKTEKKKNRKIEREREREGTERALSLTLELNHACSANHALRLNNGTFPRTLQSNQN